MSKRISIGRGEFNDICIPERYDTVSSNHADIEIQDDGSLTIIDHSRNGTIVNGVRFNNSRRSIKYGDRIQLSKSYDLPWTLIDGFLPRGGRNMGDAYGGNNTGLRHARETEMHNRERISFDNPIEEPNHSVSSVRERNIEIENAKHSWSWGGFLLNWIWAIGHDCWWPAIVMFSLIIVSFLSSIIFFPLGIVFVVILSLFNIFTSIFLGIKGNSIAWENGCFNSIEHFRSKERKWTIAGVIVLIVSIVLPIIGSLALFMFGIALLS